MQRWVHRQKGRYYLTDLVVDLFGDWTLVQCWGAFGSRRGRCRITAVESHDSGLEAIEAIARRRRQHGYQPLDDPPHRS